MHVHSSPLSLAVRLHQCQTNCLVILTMAGHFLDSPLNTYIHTHINAYRYACPILHAHINTYHRDHKFTSMPVHFHSFHLCMFILSWGKFWLLPSIHLLICSVMYYIWNRFIRICTEWSHIPACQNQLDPVILCLVIYPKENNLYVYHSLL